MKKNDILRYFVPLVLFGTLLIIVFNLVDRSDCLAQNEAMSFGMGNIVSSFLFSFGSIIFSLYLYFRYQNGWRRYSLILILAGGISNLAERIGFSRVCDYFNFGGLWYFNFPDVLICVGVASFIISILFDNDEKNIDKVSR